MTVASVGETISDSPRPELLISGGGRVQRCNDRPTSRRGDEILANHCVFLGGTPQCDSLETVSNGILESLSPTTFSWSPQVVVCLGSSETKVSPLSPTSIDLDLKAV
ncbi:hypothetical protein ElyMa_001765300 [Elysia marginata]|uniref:Deacetylase sirtuin-type domain-containing protein n=1 Tax=Elysia marginata TaxID=1093978 RepID=A0AAV4EBY1_9GAST|nr:hypothetical protein ElyMa_001765300 [Elysia marginata]